MPIIHRTGVSIAYDTNIRERTEKQKANNPPPPKEYNGYLSRNTKSKIAGYIDNLLHLIKPTKYKATFLTLTLPSAQTHDDNFIKRNMLNSFIVRIKHKYGVVNFFWRAEAQKNGNIHFHLLIDRYLPNVSADGKQGEINAIWNQICNKYGYILPHYWQYGKQPPSTHINQIKEAKDVKAYVMKYVTKDEIRTDGTGRKIDGRIWGCADSLRFPPYTTDGAEIYALEDMAATYQEVNKLLVIRVNKTGDTLTINSNESAMIYLESDYKLLAIIYTYPQKIWNLAMPSEIVLGKKKYFMEISEKIYGRECFKHSRNRRRGAYNLQPN